MLMAAASGGSRLKFDDVFTTTSASSPVTSSTRTITGTGTLSFDTVATDGGTPQYSKNGGSFTNITEGGTLAMANGDTLAVKAILATVGFTASFNIRNNGGVLIEAVTLTRS